MSKSGQTGLPKTIFVRPGKRRRGSRLLLGLTFLVIFYSLFIHFHVSITGSHQVDGILGVLLGLFTCSNPTANALEFILFGRYDPFYRSKKSSLIFWWVVNLLALIVGLILIVVSLLFFTQARR